jgi:hypothetical protein
VSTRYFYNITYVDDGALIYLISIGIAADDRRELYLINRDAPWPLVRRDERLMAEVVPYLPVTVTGNTLVPEKNVTGVVGRSTIANDVHQFLTHRGPAELWANHAAHQHVALCQLYGPMIALPKGIPYFTREFQQEHERWGNPTLPAPTMGRHHALGDAQYLWMCFDLLTEHAAAVGAR